MGAVEIILVLIALSIAFVCAIAVGAWLGAREPQRVVCPETAKEVDVTIDPKQNVQALFCGSRPCVATCSRWPERSDCDRDCQDQLHG